MLMLDNLIFSLNAAIWDTNMVALIILGSVPLYNVVVFTTDRGTNLRFFIIREHKTYEKYKKARLQPIVAI